MFRGIFFNFFTFQFIVIKIAGYIKDMALIRLKIYVTLH